MFSHFSIGRKISLGFAVVILSTIVAFYITNRTFVNSQKINEEITNNHTPSIAKLEELKLMIVRSKMLINNWVFSVDVWFDFKVLTIFSFFESSSLFQIRNYLPHLLQVLYSESSILTFNKLTVNLNIYKASWDPVIDRA